jgi:hypothetical protein
MTGGISFTVMRVQDTHDIAYLSRNKMCILEQHDGLAHRAGASG